jgi:hypothetical protein
LKPFIIREKVIFVAAKVERNCSKEEQKDEIEKEKDFKDDDLLTPRLLRLLIWSTNHESGDEACHEPAEASPDLSLARILADSFGEIGIVALLGLGTRLDDDARLGARGIASLRHDDNALTLKQND